MSDLTLAEKAAIVAEDLILISVIKVGDRPAESYFKCKRCGAKTPIGEAHPEDLKHTDWCSVPVAIEIVNELVEITGGGAYEKSR